MAAVTGPTQGSGPLQALTSPDGPDYSKVVDQNIWQPLQEQTAKTQDAQLPSLLSQMQQMPSMLTPTQFTPVMPPQARQSAPAARGGGGGASGPVGNLRPQSGNAAQREAQLRDAASKAGFTGNALNMAVAIGMAESGGNAGEVNNNPGTGDLSYGDWQINMLGGMGPSRRAQYGLSSNDALLDPYTNARVAYAMSNGGQNWSPWSTYGSGAYKQYLGG